MKNRIKHRIVTTRCGLRGYIEDLCADSIVAYIESSDGLFVRTQLKENNIINDDVWALWSAAIGTKTQEEGRAFVEKMHKDRISSAREYRNSDQSRAKYADENLYRYKDWATAARRYDELYK